MKLGKREAAIAEYKALVQINPENYKYFTALQQAVLHPNASGMNRIVFFLYVLTTTANADQLSSEDRERLSATYLELQKDSPKATAPVRIPLDFLEGFHPDMS